MNILALEFSGPRRSVAVARRQERGEFSILSAIADAGERRTSPMPIIDAALREAQIQPGEVNLVAVGLGPGSYTGIRSSIAIAQGWQLARNVAVTGVSTSDVLAWQAQASGWFGRVAVVIDAQRNEFYLAVYEISREARRLLEPLRLAKLDQVRASLAEPESILVGPEVNRWFPEGRILLPETAVVARLTDPTLARGVLGESLEPIYLRETQFVKVKPPNARH